MKTKLICLMAIASLLAQSCVVIKQGQVGMKRTNGALSKRVLKPGLHGINPLTSVMRRVPVRTQTLQARLDALPSKEGLSIASELTLVYHIRADSAYHVESELGENFERELVLPVLRSTTADITARFMAKDLHSASRTIIEKEILKEMGERIGHRGFVIENVLLKSIVLPAGLFRAIEEKLEAEQDAQRASFVLQQRKTEAEQAAMVKQIQAEQENRVMEVVLKREKQEAERKRVEAEGIRDAQRAIGQGLTPLLIQYQAVEAFKDLAKSNNAKFIITDGKSPMLLNPGAQVP